jgi:hypothetical protein
MSEVLANPSRIKTSWFFGIFGAFLIFVVIGVYSSRMAHNVPDYDQEQAVQRYATLAKVRASDEQRLTTADWVDQTKNVVRIPINEAIPEEIEALKTKPVQMSNDMIPGTQAPATMNTTPGTTLGTPAVPAHGAPAHPAKGAPPAAGKGTPSKKAGAAAKGASAGKNAPPSGVANAAPALNGTAAPTTQNPPPTNAAPQAPPLPAANAPNK